MKALYDIVTLPAMHTGILGQEVKNFCDIDYDIGTPVYLRVRMLQ